MVKSNSGSFAQWHDRRKVIWSSIETTVGSKAAEWTVYWLVELFPMCACAFVQHSTECEPVPLLRSMVPAVSWCQLSCAICVQHIAYEAQAVLPGRVLHACVCQNTTAAFHVSICAVNCLPARAVPGWAHSARAWHVVCRAEKAETSGAPVLLCIKSMQYTSNGTMHYATCAAKQISEDSYRDRS